MSIPIKVIETTVEGNQTLYIIREELENIIGIAKVSNINQEFMNIDEIFVIPIYRNHGIATELIEKVIEIADERGKLGVTLGVDDSTDKPSKLYENIGFIKSYSYPDGETACIYTYYL
jgi:ribosomal protein S18 acetylase RimI-like enzyme